MADATEALRARLRLCFPPLLEAAPPAPAFLDNAAGSLVPAAVVDAVAHVLATRGVCNAMPGYAMGRAQAAVRDEARAATALFCNAPRGGAEIALGPSATALSFRFAASLARGFPRGAAVVVSELEHECNASPWRETGAEVRVWRARWPAGELALEDLAPLLADGAVRVVALTAVSNALGLRTPVARAATAARAAGALVVVDAVHSSPHELPDVARDGIDALLFSPYKVFAPHLGALFVRADVLATLDVPTLVFKKGGLDATRLEYGTPAFELLAGWLAALRYLVSDVGGESRDAPLSRAALERAYAHIAALEAPLADALVRGLAGVAGVDVFGATAAAARVGTVAFRVAGVPPAAVARRLADEFGVCCSAGDFYAVMAVEALRLGDELGVVRASIAHYNTLEEVQKLVDGVRAIAAGAAGAVGA